MSRRLQRIEKQDLNNRSIFDTLLADYMPKSLYLNLYMNLLLTDTLFPIVYFNFKQHQISPSAYLPEWIVPLFLDHLSLEACARLWDIILLEGDSFLFRTALAVLAVLEPRLFFPDRKELLDLLRCVDMTSLYHHSEGNVLNLSLSAVITKQQLKSQNEKETQADL